MRNLGLRLSHVGLALKGLAVAAGCAALFQLGYDIQNGYFLGGTYRWLAILLVASAALAVVGSHWHKGPGALPSDVAHRPESRRFRPGRTREWLSAEAWPDFPDPLPNVPNVIGRPTADVPDCEVPPDETLRRLWLVRAQLAVHLDEQTVRTRLAAPWIRGLNATIGGLALGLVLGLVARSQGWDWALGSVFAGLFLLVPMVHGAYAHARSAALVDQRQAALEEEETRLMGRDRKRPGGPLGGPAVQPGSGRYVPPAVLSDRLE